MKNKITQFKVGDRVADVRDHLDNLGELIYCPCDGEIDYGVIEKFISSQKIMIKYIIRL
jgi:hypothetical protein